MNDWSMLKKLIWLRIIKGGGAVLKTVTGSLIHIADALALPAKALTVNVNPAQDLHGFDSPWPAGGGKNKFDRSLMADAESGAKYIDLTLKPNTAYTASSNDPMSSGAASIFFVLPGESVSTGTNGVYNNRPVTRTTGADGVVRIGYRAYNSLPIATLVGFETQVEEGSTATAFVPFANICPISGRTSAAIYQSGADTSDPTTYTIQLGDTVYGGQLDVTAGKMVVDRTMVDLGTLSFFKSSSTSAGGGSLFSIPVSSVGVGMAERVRNAPNTMISDAYKTAASDVWWANQTPDFGMSVNTNSLFVADSRYSTAADFRAAVSGVQLVYELATPFEITLTPTQIEMLLGENNVWADSGDSTLTYYADGNASTSEALGILLGGTYNNPGGAEDVSDDEALGILLGGS